MKRREFFSLLSAVVLPEWPPLPSPEALATTNRTLVKLVMAFPRTTLQAGVLTTSVLRVTRSFWPEAFFCAGPSKEYVPFELVSLQDTTEDLSSPVHLKAGQGLPSWAFEAGRRRPELAFIAPLQLHDEVSIHLRSELDGFAACCLLGTGIHSEETNVN